MIADGAQTTQKGCVVKIDYRRQRRFSDDPRPLHKRRGSGKGQLCQGTPAPPERLRNKWESVTCKACLSMKPAQTTQDANGGGE